MYHKIIEVRGGKEIVKMIDTLPVCNNRIDALRSGNRGITYKLVPALPGEERFAAKRRSRFGSGDTQLPRRIK
jgi:hypothetical protein